MSKQPGYGLLIAGLCVLIVVSLGVGLIGLIVMHQQRAVEASEFANEATEHIFRDRDVEWALAHVTSRSLQEYGAERMRYFVGTIGSLGTIEQISNAQAVVRVGLQLPNRFISQAEVRSNAKTDHGWYLLAARLLDEGRGWEIDRIWWTPVAAPENSSASQ